jgi:hypothetical protein
MKIAVILPIAKADYMANTVLDGLIDLQAEQADLDFITTTNFPSPFDLKKCERDENDFIGYANTADIIILCWGKGTTNLALADKINKWDKTVFVDGSEFGKNNRFNKEITDKVLNGSYEGIGAIDADILSKVKIYFRREKPYIKGIVAFPFGVETRYREYFKKDAVRDIDFTCIFGQDEYPIMRRQAREYLEVFCKKNNFVCKTNKTKGFSFDDNSKKAGRNDFYDILSRTKVGISIGGGGYDTARFWEILANGAMLLTEKIDIYDNPKERLGYKRIVEFTNLDDFKIKLDEVSKLIRDGYANDELEYENILNDHSTKTRVKEIIEAFKNKNK